MRLQVFTQDPSLPPAFREFVEERVSDSLRHQLDRLTHVEVHVKDVNGQKNGVDKSCVVEARPRGMDPVVASAEAAHAKDAVTDACHKLERALRNRFDKRDNGR